MELNMMSRKRLSKLDRLASDGASLLLMAWHRQVIWSLQQGQSKYVFIIIVLLPLLTARAELFLPVHLPWHALVWHCH